MAWGKEYWIIGKVIGLKLCAGEGWNAFTDIRGWYFILSQSEHISPTVHLLPSLLPLSSPPPLSPSLSSHRRSLAAVSGQAFSSLRGKRPPRHHTCANWGLMRGICSLLCTYGSPAGALAGSPLSVSPDCSRRRADAPLLPRGEQLAATAATSRTGLCFEPPSWDTRSPPPGPCPVGRVSGCSRNHHFLSWNKNNQLCPGHGGV